MTNEANLVINRWDSYCSACKGGAFYVEEYHNTLVGYSVKPDAKGCGAKFVSVSSDYGNQLIKGLREDLPRAGFMVEV